MSTFCIFPLTLLPHPPLILTSPSPPHLFDAPTSHPPSPPSRFLGIPVYSEPNSMCMCQMLEVLVRNACPCMITLPSWVFHMYSSQLLYDLSFQVRYQKTSIDLGKIVTLQMELQNIWSVFQIVRLVGRYHWRIISNNF